MTNKNLGKRIIAYRAKHNLSIGQMAMLCRVSSVTMTNVERGLQNPSRLTLTKILAVLDSDN